MAKVIKRKGRGKTLYLDYRLSDGSRITRKAKVQNMRGANRELNMIQNQLLENPHMRKLTKVTLREFCKEYTEMYLKTNLRTSKGEVNKLLKFIDYFGGDIALQNITTRQVERFKALLMQRVSPATVNRYLSRLRHLFNQARKWEYTQHNPVTAVKHLKENNQMTRFLSKEEIDRLIACCNGHLKPIVVCAIYSGLRRGELFDLKWENIDLKNRNLTVVNSKSNYSRTVPINDTLMESLKDLPSRFAGEYVYPSPKNGGRLDHIKTSFNSARLRAGLNDVRFHDLRHTFGSQLALAGMNAITIKELMGHRNLKTTERYCHLSQEHLQDAVAVLDNLSSTEQISEAVGS